MAVDSAHAEYAASAPAWSRARDVLAGEDAVRAAGERYLPRLDSQSDEEYAAYKARASFFGATAWTLAEYLDLVFRRAPVVSVGERKSLERFAADCDRWGLGFPRYARHVVSEVLSVGRGGSLVLAGDDGPFVTWFRAEDIVNWRVQRAGGNATLVEVVLRGGDRVRVLKVVDSVCVQEVWTENSESRTENRESEPEVAQRELRLKQSVVLKRGDVPLTFIPFVFHGPRSPRPEPERLPLADIIASNLDHYRLDADFKHGLHFAALPTAWVSGFDKAAPLRIGSSAAWVSDIPGATAGFLEFSGAGLAYIEKAMDKVERRMALLGARMLEGTGVAATRQGS